VSNWTDALQTSKGNGGFNLGRGNSFLVYAYISAVTSYRVHTILIGCNMPVIVQHFSFKPYIDAMPLLRLMVQANAGLLENGVIQVLAGPIKVER
jgi:hypothetical protein